MILSLFLPYIDISAWFADEKPVIFYASLLTMQPIMAVTAQQTQTSLTLNDWIQIGYWTMVALFLIRFIWGLSHVLFLMIRHDYQREGNLKLHRIQQKSTFSFFNHIFIQPEHWNKPAIDYILKHEQAHVNHKHSIDSIIVELILAFGWFNPFYYTYRRDLHLLHECQADQAVLNSDCDKVTYHKLLLNEVSGNLSYIIVNQFSYSLIKRRFKMISKNKQSRLAGLRVLLAIPAAFALTVLFSFTSLEKTPSLLQNNILHPAIQAVHTSFDGLQTLQQNSVSKQPLKSTLKDTTTNNNKIQTHYKGGFPGGDIAFMNFMKNNYRFPANVIKRGSNGYIEVSFNVSEQGEIQKLKVTKGVNPEFDKEALRVLNIMPKWTPILKDGKPCSPLFHIDISLKPNPAKRNSPPIASFGIAMGAGSVSASDEDKPALLVEKNPEFKGGLDAMLNFLKKNIRYPEKAKKSGVQGTVFVQFVVSKTGEISDVKILRGISQECDEEAIRVVKTMPNWTPGQNEGKDVPVMFQIPIKFQNK
jgi:TonB family protein